ncbi:hypothetical protein PR048_018788 [Dryococelus australis]|uniref:Neurotransmitter-gated ion-channel transmembrane domain-containing protein n=1 Tax=Dryococelus australis TaxID=614101 RepID=A0ABQ9H1Y9_9NEOP|nr:hypothetical protein PR048_018788 [Dryococelus australis]
MSECAAVEWCCRSPSTHKMSPWVKRVFLHFMPRLLMMRRPPYSLRYSGEANHFCDNGYSNELDFRYVCTATPGLPFSPRARRTAPISKYCPPHGPAK